MSPHAYTYFAAESQNGVLLHAVSTKPDLVTLQAADGPLSKYSDYGINGGFFYGEELLSIAVMNDRPVKGSSGQYGTGWFNVKYPRGTLVWDEAAGTFSVQVVSSADELNVQDRSRYFAQGGISMNLMNEAIWQSEAEAEHLPYGDEKRLRSGLIYDLSGNLWLIVTPTLCTVAEFRTAIQNNIAPGVPKEGIYLDGDGSAQLNSAEHILRGDSRALRQIITVK